MPYPYSPFSNNFDTHIIFTLKDDNCKAEVSLFLFKFVELINKAVILDSKYY